MWSQPQVFEVDDLRFPLSKTDGALVYWFLSKLLEIEGKFALVYLASPARSDEP